MSNLSKVSIRRLSDEDSLEDLTNLVHKAYKILGDQGFRYWATHQSIDDTRNRIAKGECYVYEEDDRIVGTIVINNPNRSSQCEWYQSSDTTTFHQFAVEPGLHGAGIGSALLEHVEQRALEMGLAKLACDTSEGAHDLIAWYKRRGFQQIGTVDWDGTNYLSVVLRKTLK